MKWKTLFEERSSHCYVIAEAGLNHNGSMEIAKKLIEVAALAGADAVKFQKRTVDELAVKDVLDAEDLRFKEFGTTYRQIREHLEFTFEEYQELKRYSEERGLDFIVTAFDIPAADFLEKLGIEVYKLASHSLTNLRLLEYLAGIGKPVIMSTGMADTDEVDRAVAVFRDAKTPLCLLHCVSTYPTPLSECNLTMIDVLRSRYEVPVGYSGHEIGYLPTVAAAAMGARAVERHYTLDKTMVGFDHRISLEPQELISMVRDIRAIAGIRGTGEKKVSDSELVTRKKYHVSMVSKVAIPAGTVLSDSMITYRNPGTGIPAKSAHLYLGRKVTRDVPQDVLIDSAMFE